MLDRLRERPLTTSLLLGIAAQILFSVHLAKPDILMFDEVHYVPAARAMLGLDRALNTEHPLLAKELIAAGIALFGDNPVGWRALSTLAGSATVMSAFWIMWTLYGRLRTAAFAAFLVAINQMVFVQARIAMLDGYLGAFVTAAVAAMLWAMTAPPDKVRGRLVVTGVLLGLATAVKWTAGPYVAFAGIAFLAIRWRDARIAGRPGLSALSGKGQCHWPGIGAIPALLILGLVSIAVYFATFAPQFFYARDPLTLARLVPFQLDMYALQTQILSPHPYQSSWWSWPLVIRPIWYLYEINSGAWRGVLMIGNPVIMWGGLVAVALLFYAGIRDRAARPLGLALLWTGSLAIWAVIPKSLGFYYYYYLSGIFLCLVLAAAFHRFARGRLARADEWFAVPAIAIFVFFYPILSSMPLADGKAFNHWMLFDSWR